MPPKIITVTANTAIDHVIEVDPLNLGDDQPAKSSIEFPSGKGINVAKAVVSLNTEVYALGFVGVESIGLFNLLQTALLHTDFLTVDGKTRTNLTLFDTGKQQETHIRTAGFKVTDHDCQQLIDKITGLLTAEDVLVLSGSLPSGAPPTLYETLINLAHQKSAITFLDSSGDGLRHGLNAKPYWVKPNQRELEELAGMPLSNEAEIVSSAYALIQQGIKRVVVSRGAQGLIIITDNNIALKVYVDNRIGKVVSSVGCGDALVGGLAVATLHRYPLLDALKLGLACATATLFSNEPGQFEFDQLSDISEHIVIRSL